MQSFIQYIIDFIFPPSKEDMAIRALSPEKVSVSLTKSSLSEFPFISSLFSYKDPLVRELVWQIKYKKNSHALKCAGYALYQELRDQTALLIPIPISKKRRKERGYNQCEFIIDEIIKLDMEKKLRKNYDFLIRSRHVDRQTLKNRNERMENTKDIFGVVGKIPDNSRIIIIDDVTTTGSTLKEAREAILKARYRDVRALTFAH